MSAYIEIPMAITDRECLLKALEDMGFGYEKLEVHNTARKLEGYMGTRRMNTAEIVISRKYVGGSSNDLGFKKTNKGYIFIVSKYDKRRFGSEWLSDLTGKYKVHYHHKLEKLAEDERKRIEEEKRLAREERKKSVIQKAKQMGYMVKEEMVGKQIQLVLVRREY